MKFQAEGIITFEDGLELKDPFMERSKLLYDFDTGTFEIEFKFYETHGINKRWFKNDVVIVGSVEDADVINFISTNEFLSQFSIQS